MRITILDGHPQPEAGWVEYLATLTAILHAGGAEVEHLHLRAMELRPCTGCFGCWVKTPGACAVHDDSAQTCNAQINADLVIWAAPMIMGFPSALLKQALDKSIPLVHPYFTVVDGEVHHRARYDHYPRIALLLEPEAGVAPQMAEEGLRLAEMILARTALNLKGGLDYAARTTESPAAVAHALLQGPQPLPAPPLPKATVGVQVTPPSGLLLLNGSPRGGKGNTPILLQQVAEGFARGAVSDTGARPAPMQTLMRLNEMAAHVEAVAQAGRDGHAVVIGFPLYTDAMPGSVKRFIEALAPLQGTSPLPPLAFLIQCGFPETGHLRYVEQYLQHLTARLGAPYLGSMARGGCEGVHIMPPAMTRRTFETLQALGAGLARTGRLEPALLRSFAGRDHYPAIARPLMELMVRLPLTNFYWNGMLKRNGAYARRFDQPHKA